MSCNYQVTYGNRVRRNFSTLKAAKAHLKRSLPWPTSSTRHNIYQQCKGSGGREIGHRYSCRREAGKIVCTRGIRRAGKKPPKRRR